MNLRPNFLFARRALALTALLGAGCLSVAAQEAAVAAPKLDLSAPVVKPVEMFSSSSADNETVVAENHFDFVNVANEMQPPPRKYGRPRYRGSNTNPDGSNKYAFVLGVGFTQPVGNTYHYLVPSYAFQAGAGRNFSRQFALLVQVDYDNFGFTGRTIAGQTYIYNRVFPGTGLSQLDGNTHIWSATLNPTFNVISGENGGIGMYAVGGVGFYHKAAHFFVPVSGLCYDSYYGAYYQCAANQDIDKYTSNAPGFNGGVGFTYKVSRFSGQRLFAEVRYVYVANKQRNGITVATAAPTPAQQNATNFFPANSNRTTYFPIKLGIRF